MSGVCRQALNSIQPNIQNSLVIGIIISSLNSKKFEANPSQYRGGRRAVWTFTLRDSEEDFINVTVWGSVDFIDKMVATFHIGSVVDVINAKVMVRQANDKNDIFCPTVPSPYTLTVNEGVALIQAHDSSDKSRYERFLRMPTKDLSQLRTIKSIIDVIEAMQDQLIDLLVVVTFVSESRTIVTRDGRSLVCRDIEVADGSCQETISIKLWEHEWVRMSGVWEPKNTVLFIADARVAFDRFKKKTGVTIVRKTVITENPDLPQTSEIRKSIRCDPDCTAHDPFAVPRFETIKTVMNIREITERLNERKMTDGERIQFTTILFASVTEINMEGVNNSGALITRCALCKRLIRDGNDSCMNLECPCGNGRREPMNVCSLYMKVNLKDNTGYLIGCRLTGLPAEKALGCTPVQFSAMNLIERSELKLRLQLENCDVRIQVLGPTTAFPRALYNILSIRRIRDIEDENVNNEKPSNDNDDDRFPGDF